ncbi:MAG: SIS domain-containing protein [Proteobacteria bacterium]|jgi:D-sedoheptulose 7-phosphate isomerase|nr:SIS domain-containing protein [Alphaproteobacteria bacterium]NCC03806.1 SIS domain-containing protein [Pseudomonadota bacterium]
MPQSLKEYLTSSADIIRQAADYLPQDKMDTAVDLCIVALKRKLPILVCGNGGSAADAMHIAGELVARFLKERKGMNCICLSANTPMITAWANDYDYESVFARQVEAHGADGAVLIALSTSGNSKNVLQALDKAKEMGMSTICLTGQGGGKMASFCDVLLDVPSTVTPIIQQVHLCYYHLLCEMIEDRAVTEGLA